MLAQRCLVQMFDGIKSDWQSSLVFLWMSHSGSKQCSSMFVVDKTGPIKSLSFFILWNNILLLLSLVISVQRRFSGRLLCWGERSTWCLQQMGECLSDRLAAVKVGFCSPVIRHEEKWTRVWNSVQQTITVWEAQLRSWALRSKQKKDGRCKRLKWVSTVAELGCCSPPHGDSR